MPYLETLSYDTLNDLAISTAKKKFRKIYKNS